MSTATAPMLAFHGDAQLKADMMTELAWHREQDKIVKGTYGERKNGQWRGCAVGCSIHSLNRKTGSAHKTSSHSVYETGFGIPIRLAYLEDRIFENLPDPLHLAWPERIMGAIKPGANLTLVSARFLHWILIDPVDGVIQYAKKETTKASIQGVGDLYLRIVEGGTVSDDEWSKARGAAYAAAAASVGAAYAAAAASVGAAYAAAVGAYAAYAAYAAAAARSNKWVIISDKLVELLESA